MDQRAVIQRKKVEMNLKKEAKRLAVVTVHRLEMRMIKRKKTSQTKMKRVKAMEKKREKNKKRI